MVGTWRHRDPVDSLLVPSGATDAMTTLPESDDQTFRLASGEEVDLLAPDGEAGSPAAPPATAPPAPARRAAGPRAPRPTYRDRRTAGRLRARKVRRLVRHVEPWSVLKISLIFYFCLWVIFLIAGVILWSLAVGSGMIDNIESFLEEILALDSFEFNADQIFRASALGGLVLVVAGSGFTVLVAVLFNLISDITGGMRITVVEEETARPRPKRTRPRRGPGVRAPTQVIPPGAVPDRPVPVGGAADDAGDMPVLPTVEAPDGASAEVATAPPDR